MFIPGSTNPVDHDRTMRAGLADSLEYIHATIGARLDLPAPEVRAAVDAIRSHRVAPGVFGRYYKVVVAVEARDFAQARTLFLQILDLALEVPEFSALTYTDAALGGEKRLYGDIVNPKDSATPWIAAPPAEDGFAQRVSEALALIEAADPALAAECRGLIVRVVGAAPSGAPGAMSFGSVSSFMLWGLAIVNMQRYATAAILVEALTHEAAHLLLYAHSLEEPLVTNPVDERYTSPLRADPRPMDGIIHATFVSARLHYLNAKLRQRAGASLEDLDSRLAMYRGLYFGGLETVREHGKLTGAGRRILEESLDYMTAA